MLIGLHPRSWRCSLKCSCLTSGNPSKSLSNRTRTTISPSCFCYDRDCLKLFVYSFIYLKNCMFSPSARKTFPYHVHEQTGQQTEQHPLKAKASHLINLKLKL